MLPTVGSGKYNKTLHLRHFAARRQLVGKSHSMTVDPNIFREYDIRGIVGTQLTDEVVSSYLVEPESNRFGLINAFTNAAQKLGPLQRIEIERVVGTLLEAPLQ